MNSQQKALAQLMHWNQNGYQPNAPAWGTVQAPVYTQPVKPQTRGRGGFLSSLISEIGGAGGAAGGAAVGTALLPGVGTIVGAGLGGLLGGFGGRVAENEVRDSRVGVGDALKEGLFSGALSAGGAGFQAFKTARGAKALGGVLGEEGTQIATRGATKSAEGTGVKFISKDPSAIQAYKQGLQTISELGDPAAKRIALNNLNKGAIEAGHAVPLRATQAVAGVEKTAIPEIAGRTGMLENKGLGLTSKTGGYYTGATVPGSSPLKPSDVKKYDQLLRKLKIPANDASDLAKGIESRLQQIGGLVDNGVAAADKPLASKELSTFGKELVDKVRGTAGLTSTGEKFAQEQATKLSKVRSVSELLDFRKQLDKSISYVANPEAATAERQAVSRIFRTGIKDKVNSLVPGLKSQNNLYHDLSSLNDYVLQAAKRGASSTTGSGGGIAGRLLSSPTANTLKAKGGAALSTVGRGVAGTAEGNITGPLSQVARQFKIQSPGNLVEALGGATQPTQPLDTTQPNPYGMPPEVGQGQDDMSQFSAPDATQAPQQSPYPLQQALSDIQRDPKNADQYMQIYNFISKSTTPDKQSIKAQDAMAAGSQALNIVDQLEQAYGQAGGAQGRVKGNVSSLLGKAGQNDAVNVYNDSKMAFLSNVARSLGERGVLTDADIERVAKAFPSPSANPQEAAAKWSIIRTIISGGIEKFQNAYGASDASGSSSDLLSALSQGY